MVFSGGDPDEGSTGPFLKDGCHRMRALSTAVCSAALGFGEGGDWLVNPLAVLKGLLPFPCLLLTLGPWMSHTSFLDLSVLTVE